MPWLVLQKSKESGLYLGLVTMNPQSTLGKMADGMIILPGDSKGNNEEKQFDTANGKSV